MTCGIYMLVFEGTDKVYIGQSVNIEKRYKQHLLSMRNRECSPKLLNAVGTFGYPKMEILSECLVSELDEQEDDGIEIYNSVDNGFNTYSRANEAPTYTGKYGYGNTKYPKDIIISALNYLVDTDFTYSQISEIIGIPTATISNISSLLSHTWLREEYPEKYKLLELKKGNRDSYAVISNKLSAKSKGIIYPLIMSPTGEVFEITNAYSFAKERGLAPNHFQEVLNKHRKSHKGWKLV